MFTMAVGLKIKNDITDSEPLYANFQWNDRFALLARKLAVGLAFGLAAGLLGLTRLTGGNRAWLYTVIAARWLALTGRLPWRLMGFLDDAYRLGLLRTVGPAYQFRHAELQEHLTAPRPRDTDTDTAKVKRWPREWRYEL